MNIQIISCSVLLVSLAFLSRAAFISKEEPENKLNALNQVCGQSSVRRLKRVVGGENAELGKYPWMVAIGKNGSDGKVSWLCGGSLISDQYVVTVANCLHNLGNSTLVRVGDLNLYSMTDGASPPDTKVGSLIIHEQYSERQHINDIGLIRLDRKVEFNDLIKPICLPPPEFANTSFEGRQVELAGWGTTGQGTSAQKHLQKVVLDVTSLEECKRSYSSQKTANINDNHICTLTPGKDACQGDSGAPLMLPQDSRMYLLGLVSYGRGCADANYPGVNVRVPKYTSWILDHMEL